MPNNHSDKVEVPVPVKENIFYEQLEAVPAHKVELVFKTAAGKEMTIEADSDDTIGTLKFLCENDLGIPKDQQRMIRRHKTLSGDIELFDDNSTVSQYGLGPEHHIHVTKYDLC